MNGKEQANTSQDTSKSPEKHVLNTEYVGFQSRILIGGQALNPENKILPEVTKESFGNFQDRDYSVFNTASSSERKSYWQGKEGDDFNRQKTKWVENTVAVFKWSSDFSGSNQGKRWSHLYGNIGIDTQNVTSSSIEAFYNKYLTGETKQSNIKTFVADVVSHYKQADGTIDYTALKGNLDGIQWISNVFGTISSEVITQLVDAEVKLQTQPDTLVNQANETQTVNNNQILRINNLNEDEIRLLNFLKSKSAQLSQPTQQPKPPQQPQPSQPKPGYSISYNRFDKPSDPNNPDSKKIRNFPNVENVRYLTHPRYIAQALKVNFPQVYGNADIETLANEVNEEQKALDQEMRSIKLPPDYYASLIKKNLDDYEGFLEKKYGLKLPEIKNLTILPLSGKTAELHNPSRVPFAFVNPTMPVIFLDFDVIKQEAIHLRKPFTSLTPEEVGKLVTRLLLEIHPHEYTHLVADIANWQLEKDGQLKDTKPGKVGIALDKPVPPKIDEQSNKLIIKGRGNDLNEGITYELTQQWAASINHKLDIHGYEAEDKVLHALINKIASEENMTSDEVFEKFVEGYFSPQGYKNLVEFLSGRKKDAQGLPIQSRPHYLQTIYALMEYEHEVYQGRKPPEYSLTLAFITNTLNANQKQQILRLIQAVENQNTKAQLSPATRQYLSQKMAEGTLPQAA